jgi:hypothetical protein
MSLNKHAITAALVSALPWLGGCVERKITVVSDPPGALAYLNDQEIGRTPVTTPFLWYGDYDVRLRYDKPAGPGNAEPQHYYLHTHRRAEAPAYEWIGPDLFAEVLPFDLKDEKVWAFVLEKVPQESDQALIDNAKNLQQQLNTKVPLRNEKK